MKAFQHFDRTLGREHRTRTEAEIEAGAVEAPKPRKTGRGRPRARREERNGPDTLRLPVDPRFTAAAALTAARTGSTTNAVVAQWLETLAFADAPKDPRDRVVTFSVNMAVGPDAFPPDVFKDLCEFADSIGVSPNRLATGIVKQMLAEERAKRDEAAA